MTADVETIVVGAGVVGLAAARACALAGQDVLVLEQHPRIGEETSSRNSEIVHAGLYYAPGSLRARLCVRGKEMLYAFCAEAGVAHRRTGKLLVATADGQLGKLNTIAETARRNGVLDVVPMTGAEARRLEPELSCVAALLSPSTGTVDSHGLMLALEGHLEQLGGQVVLRTPVDAIRREPAGGFRLVLAGQAGGEITCARLVLSAGLHATKLARKLQFPSGYVPPETYY